MTTLANGFRPLTYGMVGGGQGAFIGEVHRKAINFDALALLKAGCFSISLKNTRATGAELGVDPERLYADFAAMAVQEAARPDPIDFVVIVTPNHTHFPVAKAFLEAGIHVVCDKPLTLEVAEGEALKRLAAEKGCLFCVTYTYTGYPAVKQAGEMIARGELGALRFINAEYAQEWLATALERTGHKQAAWRTDPTCSGIANSVGDIGTHVENLIATTTGLEICRLSARLDRFGEGRLLDDNASIMVAYEGGARGLYWVSQIAIGAENGLRFRIYGTEGSLEWHQEDPNYLRVGRVGQPNTILSRGREVFHPSAQDCCRVPAGHPEGYFEAFANLYKSFIETLSQMKAGARVDPTRVDFPTVDAGIAGVKFIHKCVESSSRGAVWVEY